MGNILGLYFLFKSITKIIDKVTKEKKYMYLMGDYNINLLNVDSHALTSQFINNSSH